MKNQKRLGIIISYVNTALNMCISIFFTPLLISSLGQAEYGVYRIVQSFVGQLSIMTFGISTLVTRNIVYFNEKKEQKGKENFLAMSLIISTVLAIITLIIGVYIYHSSDYIFSSSFTSEEKLLAKKLIFLLVLNIAVIILTDFFNGILMGHEKFAIAGGSKTVRMILRIATLVILLLLGFKSTAIVATDLLLNVLIMIFDMVYGLFVLKERIKFHFFDKPLFRSSMLFSSAILLQAIINQINQNLDSVILGIMTDSKTVAVYSIALIIYTTYNSLISVVSTVFTPQATRLVVNGASNDELTDFVARPGRFQFMMCGIILIGFTLFGKEFISLWLGPEYIAAHKIALILIIPTTIPLIQNVTNSILDAKLKRMARSLILGFMAIINVVISVFLIKAFGYIGAAYGTACSVIIGHIIIMNIYYKKVLGLDVIRMFKTIFDRLLPCIIVLTAILFPFRNICLFSNPWLSFIAKLTLFVIVYYTIIYFIGMQKNEKNMVNSWFSKIKKNV